MTKELLESGSLYTWCELQFWRLRFAGGGTTTLGCTRLNIQHNKLKGYVSPDKLRKPPKRSTAAGTKAELAVERSYSYELSIFNRLSSALHAAYASLDAYLNQMGALLRPAHADELSKFSPTIDTERRDNLTDLALSSQ
eukprot:15962897-Heterocapsa_arctica.AAC.1